MPNAVPAEKTGSPFYQLLNEINRAAANGLPLIAVAMVVALPDICVSLSSNDGRTNGDRYKEWCRNNLGAEFKWVTPDDLYSMRCGVLHNGRFGDLKHNVGRVIFALPDGTGNAFINCQMNDAYFYSAVEFCKNFTQAVFDWMEANKQSETVRANIGRLMQYRNGFPPYVAGAMVLA